MSKKKVSNNHPPQFVWTDVVAAADRIIINVIMRNLFG